MRSQPDSWLEFGSSRHEKATIKGVQSPMPCDACGKRFLYMALVCRPAVTRACKGLQSRPANTEAADTRSCFDQCMFQSIRTCLPEHCFLVSEPLGSLSPFAEWCDSIRSLRLGSMDCEGLALTSANVKCAMYKRSVRSGSCSSVGATSPCSAKTLLGI